MSDDRLSFDDFALIRTFSCLGVDCDKKISRLIGQLSNLLKESGIGCGSITQQDLLFRPTLRTVVCRQLFDQTISGHPSLMLGIEKDHLVAFLETPSSNEKKRAFHEALMSVAPRLAELDPGWRVRPLADRTGKDVEIRWPLLDLLATEDQQPAFVSFFSKALGDLKEAGVIEAYRAAIDSSDDDSKESRNFV